MKNNQDLPFYKQEKDRITSEINDLQARIIVASGHKNRDEVNNYRQRINFLKRKLREVSQRIYDLENGSGEIQVVMPSISIPK